MHPARGPRRALDHVRVGHTERVSDAPAPVAARPRGLAAVAVASAVLIAIVLTFAMIRATTDWPHIVNDTASQESDDREGFLQGPRAAAAVWA